MQQHARLEGTGPSIRKINPRVLEGRTIPSYEWKRAHGSKKHSTVHGKRKRQGFPVCGQLSHLYYLILKGLTDEQGRGKNPFNKIFQPFFHWLIKIDVTLEVKWVPSSQCLANTLSRWGTGQGGLRFGQKTASSPEKNFFNPSSSSIQTIFATPRNKSLADLCPDGPIGRPGQQMPCSSHGNPGGPIPTSPWSIIKTFLTRLQLFHKAKVLMWSLFWLQHHVGSVNKSEDLTHTMCEGEPIPRNVAHPLGRKMPPTRWTHLCLIFPGQFYRGLKVHLHPFTVL